MGLPILTHDPRRYRAHFSEVEVIAPEAALSADKPFTALLDEALRREFGARGRARRSIRRLLPLARPRRVLAVVSERLGDRAYELASEGSKLRNETLPRDELVQRLFRRFNRK
jgi:hypothetical protein